MAILLKLRPKNTKIHLIKERQVNNKIHFVKKHLYKFHFRNNPIPLPWKQKFREHAGEGKDGEGRSGKGRPRGGEDGQTGRRCRIPGRGESPRGKEKNRPACPGKDRGAEGC